MPKIVGIPLQFTFLSQVLLHVDFLLTGEINLLRTLGNSPLREGLLRGS